ncbi:unnamed protein product [Moneuplotes crassus]|uniref:Aminopeptidase n=1 Tax=Euplotes crassus TaxID=5936 RepID=A0AAD1XUP0_EUPCR|nr:unnamed protein product [Moneuplotes crassus]
MEKLSKNAKIGIGVAATVVAIGGYWYLSSKRASEPVTHVGDDKQAEQEPEGYQDPGYEDAVCLYREEAIKRKKLVDNVHYNNKLVLLKGKEYHGKSTVVFTLKNKDYQDGEVFIDFQCKIIKTLAINGKAVEVKDHFLNQRINFNSGVLQEGENTIELTFLNNYRKTGTGLHKFVDPADDGEYLYTQFEPFDAHRAIPCFDQPDIKATMTLALIAPEEHVSLSNSHEDADFTNTEKPEESSQFIEENGFRQAIQGIGNYRITKFSKTPKISAYLFAIISGPYDVVEKQGNAPGKDEPLRMRFLCRKSLVEYISQAYDHMHEAVVTGIEWYTEFFGTPFPWSKYDQIFCPEFRFGAMENVGAVTFSEAYIPTGKLGTLHLTRLTNTTLHELCHQWFGNLATMTWWDDLWLNEAFATYMAYHCTSENEILAKKTPGFWVALNMRKQAALNSDSLSTTHPIVKDAVTTDSADDMVNAITYGKGSSFIKQLIHMIGREAMSKGCTKYFKNHAYSNTNIDDFLDALSYGCATADVELEVNLRKYCIDFLTHQGVNKVDTKIEDIEGGIKITFTKSNMKYSQYINAQKMDYYLFDEEYNCELHSIVLTDDSEPQTVEIKGRTSKNTFILPNAGDHAYILSSVSDRFIDHFKEEGIQKVPSNLDRTVIWRTLIAMVKNKKLKSTEFFDIVAKNIFKESDLILLSTLLTTVKPFISLYIPKNMYGDLVKKMFEGAKNLYESLPESQKELKNLVKNHIFSYLHDKDHIKAAASWYSEGTIELEDEDKKAIILAAIRSQYLEESQTKDLLEKYLQDNQTDRGERFKITADAAVPTKENKERVWNIIINPRENELSSWEYRAYISGFYSRFQKDLLKDYPSKYLEALPKLVQIGEKDLMTIFTSGAFPPSYLIDQDFLDKVNKIVTDFEKKDKVKYDSFIKLARGIIESKQGQARIEEFARIKDSEEEEKEEPEEEPEIPEEELDESEITEINIEGVINNVRCSREEAVQALRVNRNDVTKAVSHLNKK